MRRREREVDEDLLAPVICLHCYTPGRHWVEPTRKVTHGYWVCDIGASDG